MTYGPLPPPAPGPGQPSPGMGSFGYDARNRLRACNGVSYTYDAENLRTQVTTPSGDTDWVINPAGAPPQPLVRSKPDGTITRYIWGLGLLYEEEDATGQTKTYHYDRRGSTVALSADDGRTVTDRWAYGPYGERLSHSGASDTPFQFNGFFGVQTDPNGLLYMNARYYHVELRRFLSEDPIGFAGGNNFYAYCGGDPISRSDPTGLWFGVDDAIFAGSGAVVGVGSKFVANLITGNKSSCEEYVGAAVGGAAGGETLLYTANPYLAGAAGGAFGNASTQGLKIASGKQQSFSVSNLAVDTGIGAAFGAIPGRPIPGINAGRNSSAAIFEQIVTKASNGTINSVTTQTAQKMAVGAFVRYSVVEGAVGGTTLSNICENMTAQPQVFGNFSSQQRPSGNK